ncbi:MAG: T9SS type A sorting domain-containing protein [Ignavibacteriales bacterium]|nr:T9SS type A sorting domain-containing protein [Ignavibacteriales bacterium]
MRLQNFSKAIKQFYHSNFTIQPTDIHEQSENNVPNDFKLLQNYPSPFNPSTKIGWQSPVSSWQTLKVYDILGNDIITLVDEYKPAGSYEVEFSARGGLASGIYFYQLKVGSFMQSKKMIFSK